MFILDFRVLGICFEGLTFEVAKLKLFLTCHMFSSVEHMFRGFDFRGGEILNFF